MGDKSWNIITQMDPREHAFSSIQYIFEPPPIVPDLQSYPFFSVTAELTIFFLVMNAIFKYINVSENKVFLYLDPTKLGWFFF